LQQGYRQFKKKCKVTDEAISAALGKQHLEQGDPVLATPEVMCPSTRGQAKATDHELREMNQLLSLLQEGGVGYMPSDKRDGWVRLMFKNWNSLGIFTEGWKMDRLSHLIRDLQVDVIAGCETQCDWRFVPPHRQLTQLLCPGRSTVAVAANNTNESINWEQMGGTALAAIGRISDSVTDKG
jgi:hypothetical protein